MPVSIPPTNTTPETAFILNGQVPLDATIDLTGLANPQRVWFKYTLGSTDFGLAVYATGDDGFAPVYKFRFNDPLSAPYQSGSGYPLEAFIEESVGLAKVGVVYISLENGILGGPITSPLFVTHVKIHVSENAEAPIGSLIINNDLPDYPLTIVKPTGEPTQLRSFVAGESAANLENGLSLWSDYADDTLLHLYDANLVKLRSITWPRGFLRAPVSSDRHTTFYVATSHLVPAKIAAISSAGVVTTEWTIDIPGVTTANIYALAPSWLDSDVLYVYSLFYPTGLYAYGVSRFHKSTGVLDATFIDTDDPDYTLGGFYGEEFLVFPDDSRLFMFRGETDSKVKLFDATGTFVREFVIPDADVNRLAYDGITYTSFWTWSFTMAAFDSRFIRFRLSDGAVLEDFTLPTTSSGNGFSSVPGGASDSLFGVPECCPILTPPVVIPPYGPPGEPPSDDDSPPNGTDAANGCVTAPVRVDCWHPHDIDVLKIGLQGEGQP